ncbi:MAG: NAD-glutamate dehydrogenase [Candidatus Aquirickettsiella gammari]|uniref:NAD-glutamate dehydrogenase n=1 Tax=Candidatus Aquirickettsiella gammari TaxID=2016198 RepID=A0A370CIM8_9COXI|nr:MAG: NAD-glutamate dehydrogenase [Candidatus Aquirickettsiella gammari]
MNNLTNRVYKSILEKILRFAQQKVPKEQSKLFAVFAQQYYAHTDLEALASCSVENLAAALASHWNLLYQRLPGQAKIRVYNPSLEKDAWETKYSVVQLVTEDKPFLVDSTRMEVNRQGFDIYFSVHLGNIKLRRNQQGKVVEVLPYDTALADKQVEALVYLEIDKESDAEILHKLAKKLETVLEQVNLVVKDWPEMRSRMQGCLQELKQNSPPYDPEDVAESKDFLAWLLSNHFTFLGCRDYDLSKDHKTLRMIKKSGLGVLRDETRGKEEKLLTELPPEARRLAFSPQILVISKTNSKSRVHRSVYADYIGVKRFNERGELVGERRFIGLYTSTVYHSDPRSIPLIRRKIQLILQNSNLPLKGHAGKALLDILSSLPRDDLFQASVNELTQLALGILHIQEQRAVRLFVRQDNYRRFISCLVYLPKEQLNTELQRQMEKILVREFSGIEIGFSTLFGDSNLARIHFLIRTDPKKDLSYDVKKIEAQLVEVARSWKEELRQALLEYYGEEEGARLIQKYMYAFPSGYRDSFSANTAVHDIEQLERISSAHPLEMNFYPSVNEKIVPLRFKLFQADKPIILSDALPVLENMGLRVMDEWPQEITLPDCHRIWINDFGVKPVHIDDVDVSQVKEIFQEAFSKIWSGEVENDGFNRLILAGQLTWREVSILRAYTKYLRQIGVPFSQAYVEIVVSRNAGIAKILVKLFKYYFDPSRQDEAGSVIASLEKSLQTALDAVLSLDEDRILRNLFEVIQATLRTNYYQKDKHNKPKPWLAFKLDPSRITDLPLPRPMYEIFVYSPRVEAVHLRAAKVARGGIRWSDRREDFRTEILGLMKAQQVKNAVIVPAGAKGGFVCKRLPESGDREAVMNEVVACYQTFMRGLLDLTDNLQNGVVIYPQDVVRYDEEDPYLVVAADKGTASFSDIANAIAAEYHFWLGDAFASGGSVGYDHKKMGITARGAWESVKRHCRALGLNPDKDDFTVVGIGDMSGDVFGNGMLLSHHIKLVAAFNHMHIFIDPNPDAAKSFQERQRLFKLPRSSWQDYTKTLISKGGGVFLRSQKSIVLSPEIKQLLGISQDSIAPDGLIRAILKAKVDLLWNGGIGTYVKSSSERNVDVGDRTNDNLRIDAEALRCRIVAEGGNLGLTQLGRVEYALNGGLIYTDFIDNSAGVDCSDHEVNCKILLNAVVAVGEMTLAQRNELLAEMTDEIAKLVLYDNYCQTRTISLAAMHAQQELEFHRRYIQELERHGKLDRALEFLPDEKALLERKALGKGLTSPEIAVLLAYTKMWVKAELLEMDTLEEDYLTRVLESAFPKPLRGRFPKFMQHHSLRREIIATKISNAMVNDMGITFVFRLKTEIGADIASIARAYAIAHHVFGFSELLGIAENLSDDVAPVTRYAIMRQFNRLIRRATRWFIYNYKDQLTDILGMVDKFRQSIVTLNKKLPDLLIGEEREFWERNVQGLIEAGISEAVAKRIASVDHEYALLDIIEAAQKNNLSLQDVAELYFMVGEKFGLTWLRSQIMKLAIETLWDTLARVILLDDLYIQQRHLTVIILQCVLDKQGNNKTCLEQWTLDNQAFIRRWEQFLADLRSTGELKLMMFSVVIRELVSMVEASGLSQVAS